MKKKISKAKRCFAWGIKKLDNALARQINKKGNGQH